MKRGAPMRTSAIEPEAGRDRAASSPRSNGIRANYIRASASSSPNMARRAESVVGFCNKGGTCEQYIKEGKGAIKWTVVPVVRRQRRAPPASHARLQPRQPPAHAGHAGADQGLDADDAQGKADQDRHEGRRSRTPCRVPDGGGHSTRPVSGHFADDRRPSATACHINGVVRLGVTSLIETTGEACLRDGKLDIFAARRGIRRPATPSTRPAGATGLSEPISRGRIGPESQAIRRVWANRTYGDLA